MQVKDISRIIEELAPLPYQESYDNSGLQTGDFNDEVTGILITLDVTENVIDEAIQQNLNLILTHHPLIFSGIKKLTGRDTTERCVIKAIRNNISIYAAHTNLDSVHGGINTQICKKLGLQNCRVLSPVEGHLKKLVTFVPSEASEKVRKALFDAGAGHIGNYDSCSFNLGGKGTFRGNESSNPFVGEIGQLHFEEETRIETIFPKHIQKRIITALTDAHPYEEVAYDIYPLENPFVQVGIGMVGELKEPIDESKFLELAKQQFDCKIIKHTAFLHKKVKKIAVVGGSGSGYIKNAIASGADVFLTGDLKYHQFFEAENKILIADIGHFESEFPAKELFYELLTKKFPTFAVHLSEVNTNPVKYLV